MEQEQIQKLGDCQYYYESFHNSQPPPSVASYADLLAGQAAEREMKRNLRITSLNRREMVVEVIESYPKARTVTAQVSNEVDPAPARLSLLQALIW